MLWSSKINENLYRLIQQRKMKKYGISIVWFIIVIIMEQLFIYPYTIGRFGIVTAVAVYILLLLIVPYKLNIFRDFFDRSYDGQIIEIEHQLPQNIQVNKSIGDVLRNESYDSMAISKIKTESKLHLWINSNQKKIQKTIRIKDIDKSVPYRENDYIRYFKGTNYPMIVKRNKPHSDDGIVCVWCLETMKNQNTDICQSCGMPLMIPSDETKAEH